MRGWLPTAVLALAVAAPALLLGSAASAWEEPDIGSREMWEESFQAARDEVAQARQRVREATQAYQRARHRRRVRGEAKQKVIDELAQAKASLEAAERSRDELFERARRAGVPPGWMRAKRSDPAAEPGPADEPQP